MLRLIETNVAISFILKLYESREIVFNIMNYSHIFFIITAKTKLRNLYIEKKSCLLLQITLADTERLIVVSLVSSNTYLRYSLGHRTSVLQITKGKPRQPPDYR